jgi:hypothetical protein
MDYEIRNNLSCLAPIIDFSNHSYESNAFGDFDTKTQLYILSSNKNNDDNKTTRAIIHANEQICITYDYHNNQTLLIEYGFVMRNNAYDTLVFDLEADIDVILRERIGDEQMRMDVLNRAIRENLVDDLSCNGSEGPSWSILRLLNLISQYEKTNNDNDVVVDSNEIGDFEAIRVMYVGLVRKYERYLSECEASLEAYLCRCEESERCRAQMVLSLSRCQLAIVNFNLEMANDNLVWCMLF